MRSGEKAAVLWKGLALMPRAGACLAGSGLRGASCGSAGLSAGVLGFGAGFAASSAASVVVFQSWLQKWLGFGSDGLALPARALL